ncbi:MAG: hypothetical protein PG981_000002 [Wolbachia endosymbiont of Ctenocephalides orientis wCori]|nr:MAG: hypothetical protein PG981_000002 [Wolbachia endosymbiont of Ctenocephalides orientis wCori]
MTASQEINSNPVNNQYSGQVQQTDLNTVSGKYSEQGQQTELSSSNAEIFSSSNAEILTHVAMSRHSVEELSKYIKLLESQNIELLKKQRTNTLPGSIGNMAGGAVGAIAGSAIYHAIASNWSIIAPALVNAAEAIVAAAPVIGIVAGFLAAVSISLFCFYKMYQHREKIKEGAADIGKKITKGLEFVGKEVKKGYEYSTDSLKRGTSRALYRSGSFLTEAAHSGEYLMESDFSQRILENNGIKDVVNDTIKAVKANDSCVLKTIQDTIKSLIDSKAEELKSKNVVDATGQNSNLEVESKLRKQSRVVDRLGTILTQNMPNVKSLELVTQIFSEYKGEIEGILKDYKENPKNYPKPTTLSRKVSESMSSSFSSLRRKSSNKSEASSSIANSTASSQAELLDSGKQKKVESNSLFSSLKAKMLSLRRSNSASYNVTEYEQLPDASTPTKTLSRSSITGSTSSFGSLEGGEIGSPGADSDDGYTQIKKARSSSNPGTTVKARPPVVPPKPASVSPPSGSVTSTQAEVYTQPEVQPHAAGKG